MYIISNSISLVTLAAVIIGQKIKHKILRAILKPFFLKKLISGPEIVDEIQAVILTSILFTFKLLLSFYLTDFDYSFLN